MSDSRKKDKHSQGDTSSSQSKPEEELVLNFNFELLPKASRDQGELKKQLEEKKLLNKDLDDRFDGKVDQTILKGTMWDEKEVKEKKSKQEKVLTFFGVHGNDKQKEKKPERDKKESKKAKK